MIEKWCDCWFCRTRCPTVGRNWYMSRGSFVMFAGSDWTISGVFDVKVHQSEPVNFWRLTNFVFQSAIVMSTLSVRSSQLVIAESAQHIPPAKSRPRSFSTTTGVKETYRTIPNVHYVGNPVGLRNASAAIDALGALQRYGSLSIIWCPERWRRTSSFCILLGGLLRPSW